MTPKELIYQIPPILDLPSLTPDEASSLAYEFAKDCWYETLDIEQDHSRCNRDPELLPGYHSTYLYEVMEKLLSFGADPNYTVDGDWPLMEHIIHTVNSYVAADTLRLLLEHGGDPNLTVDGERLFDEIDFIVSFDTVEQFDRRRYDSLVHCWFVLIGFGGTPSNGSTPLDLFDEWNPDIDNATFNPEKLRDHRNYTFGLTHTVNRGSAPTIHIFDRRTYWEVARL